MKLIGCLQLRYNIEKRRLLKSALICNRYLLPELKLLVTRGLVNNFSSNLENRGWARMVYHSSLNHSYRARLKNICTLSGRRRGVIKIVRLSRGFLRDCLSMGYLPGFKLEIK